MKGFTLVEVVVVFVICAVIAAVAIPVFTTGTHKIRQREDTRPIEQQYGCKIVCIEGYKFIIKYNLCTQIIDAEGHGILCNGVE